jgi:carbonyl reductase 1
VQSGIFSTVILGCRHPGRGLEAAKAVGGEYMPLDISSSESIQKFAESVRSSHGRLDCLVNNAAIAFKAADPTPFEGQTKPTLDTNLRGTLELTETLLPLMDGADDPRIVNVASMAGRLGQLSPGLQTEFTAAGLTLDGVRALVDRFERDVRAGTHKSNGWGSSNYGLSKLAVIAATRVLARTHPQIRVNSCCPGYCDTDSAYRAAGIQLACHDRAQRVQCVYHDRVSSPAARAVSSHKGPRPPSEGARNAVRLVTGTREMCPTGAFYQNEAPSQW